MCSLAQASWKTLTLSDTICVLLLLVAHHSARYAACALRGLYLLTSTAASGDDTERCMSLPDCREPGTRPYRNLPANFDFSLFSICLQVPSQYWQVATLPPTMRGIICGVPQPG